MDEQPQFADGDQFYRHLTAAHARPGDIDKASCPVEQWQKGLSCDWSRLRTPLDTVEGKETFFVIAVTFRACKHLGIEVSYCPTDDNPAHCELSMPGLTRNAIGRARDKFLKDHVELIDVRLLAKPSIAQQTERAEPNETEPESGYLTIPLTCLIVILDLLAVGAFFAFF